MVTSSADGFAKVIRSTEEAMLVSLSSWSGTPGLVTLRLATVVLIVHTVTTTRRASTHAQEYNNIDPINPADMSFNF